MKGSTELLEEMPNSSSAFEAGDDAAGEARAWISVGMEDCRSQQTSAQPGMEREGSRCDT